ncbi:MAG: hypothetical protein Kow0069_31050 [Promethearchaeota archaeon]
MPTFAVLDPGLLREVSIGLKFVTVALCVQFVAIFARDAISALRLGHRVQLLPAWMLFFAAFAVTQVLYGYGDFYAPESLRNAYLDWGYNVVSVAATALVYIVEKNFPYRTRGFFWKSAAILTAFLFVVPREPSRMAMFFAAGPFYLGFSVVFFIHLLKTMRGKATRPIWRFFGGFLLALTGTVFSSDEVIFRLGLVYYGVGNFLIAWGFGIMGVNALQIRSFEELEWPSAIRQILIARKGGEFVYSYSFARGERVGEEEVNVYLQAGGVSGVNSLIREISQSKENLQHVKLGDVALEFYHGRRLLGVVFSRTHLDVLAEKLRRLVEKAEAVFGDLLDEPGFADKYGNQLRPLVADEFGGTGETAKLAD